MAEYKDFISEITKLLSENGICLSISPVFDYVNSGIRKGVVDRIVELDFSTHDKVFEDKIAELKAKIAIKDNDYKTVSGLLSSYQQENESLKKRIEELESVLEKNGNSVSSEIDTSSPLACAESLIEHMTHCEKFMIMPERDVQTFSVEELREIADYLMVYYRHHRGRDAEETISF